MPRRFSTLLAAATACVAVIAVSLGAQTDRGRDLLAAAGLAGEQTGYTELAFAAPQRLPAQVPATSFLNPPAFTIHNVTGHRRDYGWSVLLTESGRGRTVASGRVVLADDQPVTITPVTKALCQPGHIIIRVRLEGSGETIYHRAVCSADIDSPGMEATGADPGTDDPGTDVGTDDDGLVGSDPDGSDPDSGSAGSRADAERPAR